MSCRTQSDDVSSLFVSDLLGMRERERESVCVCVCVCVCVNLLGCSWQEFLHFQSLV